MSDRHALAVDDLDLDELDGHLTVPLDPAVRTLLGEHGPWAIRWITESGVRHAVLSDGTGLYRSLCGHLVAIDITRGVVQPDTCGGCWTSNAWIKRGTRPRSASPEWGLHPRTVRLESQH